MRKTLEDIAQKLKAKVENRIPIHNAYIDDESVENPVIYLDDDYETIDAEEEKNIEIIRKALAEISLNKVYDDYEEKNFSYKVSDIQYDGEYAIYLEMIDE